MPLHSNSIREIELLAKCLGAVVSTEEYRNPTVIIIEYDIIYSVSKNLQNMGILTKVLSDECVPQIIIQNFQHLNETAKKFGGSNILVVIFVNKCEISERLDVTVFDIKLKYLIIINEDENCNMDLEKFGRTLQHYDATFISQSENYTLYKFQTIIPEIDESTCDYNVKVKLTTINICVNGTLGKSVIFPAKEINNLKGCPFHVGMATLYPYSIIENKESLQNLQQINESQIRGSDYEIMKIIAYYFNASLNIYYIYKEDGGAFLHHEFISNLLNGSLDACAGGLYRVYGDSVSYSVIWILFCNFDRLNVSWRDTFLYSWGVLIGAASLQDSTTLKQKILNLFYLILCIHLTAYISVQLYSFYTIQGPPQTFKTNDEVIESDKTPYLIYDTKFFVEDAKYIAFANTSLNCSEFRDCEYKTISNKGLTIIPEGYFYPFQASTAVENEARLLRVPESIIVTYHEMVVRNDSPFVSKFRYIVTSLFEAGICDRLYLEEIGLLILAKAKNANENIMANSYRCESGCAITIKQIAGAIYVWIFGCAISLIVFVIELIN
ncbi:unnamed protein product [Parnassius apollo]|uniref:(apollo) hypothetical protein n=1 Tax=Parnassius apollo TaxID=110799 RepID=A0A8S3WX26_PARAO|nr:unnamed protein product [Parnassius apollo]